MLWCRWRRRALAEQHLLLRAIVVGAPMGFIATEAGWVVTEVGRQPWVVQGVLRTADAVTPMPGLIVPFVLFSALYVFLGVIVIYLLRRQIATSPREPRRPRDARGATPPASTVAPPRPAGD